MKGDRKRHRRRKRRKHSDPLSEKVKKLRRSSEKRIRARQKVERPLFVIAGAMAALIAVLVAFSLLADMACDWCINALILIALLGLVVWSFFKSIEVLSIRRYRHYRNLQKKREGKL